MITQHVRAFFLSLSVLQSHKSHGRVIFTHSGIGRVRDARCHNA